MTRKLTGSSLAILAVLVAAVAAATPAQAAAPEFHCTALVVTNCVTTSSGGTFGTGSNDHEFVFGTEAAEKSKVICVGNAVNKDGAIFKATAPKTTTTVDLEPEYVGCRHLGAKTVVNPNGCVFRLHLVAGSKPPTAEVDVVCPAGKKITIVTAVLPCTTSIGPQVGLKHIVLSNVGSEPTLTELTIEIEKLEYSVDNGAGCPGGLKGKAFADGIYTGHTILTGYEDEGKDSNGNPIEGSRVGLHVF